MAVPDPCSASGATKPTLRCLACILSHLREKERVFTKFLCVAHCCRANRLRRSHRRQPQVRPARIARPSRSAVRKPPAVAAKCACRRRWRGAQHLAWEGRCEGNLRSRIRHSLCCCVFHRYSQQSAIRAAHISLRRRAHCAAGMRDAHWRDPEPPACCAGALFTPQTVAFPHPGHDQAALSNSRTSQVEGKPAYKAGFKLDRVSTSACV